MLWILNLNEDYPHPSSYKGTKNQRDTQILGLLKTFKKSLRMSKNAAKTGVFVGKK